MLTGESVTVETSPRSSWAQDESAQSDRAIRFLAHRDVLKDGSITLGDTLEGAANSSAVPKLVVP